jgi:Type I phosphodiesterase / nucleotide pyrophosphatase
VRTVQSTRGPLEPDVAALLAPRSPLGLPVPAFGGRSLPNVMSSIVRAVGVELSGDVPILPPLDADLDPFGGRRAEGPIVLLLVDAFGWNALRGWTEDRDDRRAPQWKARARPITTVYPSATTSALPSLSTATPPGRHGMVGYRQFVPSFGLVADLIKMSPLGVPAPESLVGPNWSASLVCGVPNVFSRGLPAAALVRASFRGTGFTRILYDGAEFVPYSTESDLAENLRHLLSRPTPPPVIMAYWDELDAIQHLWGPRPDLMALELGQVARVVAYVAAGLDERRRNETTVLVTGDHGQVRVEANSEVPLDREPSILRHLALPPGGDRRGGLYTARSGEVAQLESALTARLPPGSRVVRSEDAVSGGLFGPAPHHPELRERLGDLLAIVPSPAALTYLPPGAKPSDKHRPGGHGGLEPDELVVPLVSAPLRELA